jgi:hypothetical protein
MHKHILERVVLTIPEDGPELATIKNVARKLRLSLDQLISRAVCTYVEEVVDQLDDPTVMQQFDPDSAVPTKTTTDKGPNERKRTTEPDES